MSLIGAIIAGLVGTAVMTVMMYVAPMMGMPKMNIAGMLGTMVIARKDAATAVGLVMHFMMGAVFAVIYALLWSVGIGSDTWVWGLIFGAVHGALVAAMMPLMMRMHPRSPEMGGGPLAVMGQLLGHMVYGLVVALVYAAS